MVFGGGGIDFLAVVLIFLGTSGLGPMFFGGILHAVFF